LGEITALPRPLGDLRGPTSKGRERKEREGKGRWREGYGGEKKMNGPLFKFQNTPLAIETAVCTNNKKAVVVWGGRLGSPLQSRSSACNPIF